jgi:hypothetical protein
MLTKGRADPDHAGRVFAVKERSLRGSSFIKIPTKLSAEQIGYSLTQEGSA